MIKGINYVQMLDSAKKLGKTILELDAVEKLALSVSPAALFDGRGDLIKKNTEALRESVRKEAHKLLTIGWKRPTVAPGT